MLACWTDVFIKYMIGECACLRQSKVVPTIERMPKRQRHQLLAKLMEENPFMTDRELTRHLKVSIQTIRLDRMELGIPELRERLKLMAERSYDTVRSLPLHEVIGEIVDLQLDKSGISIFEIREEHVFSRTGIARGHHVFAQANSLAVAIIDNPIALTVTADIRFIRPVKLDEKCIAKAYVRSISGERSKAKVEIFTYVGEEMVFQGDFVIFRSAGEAEKEGGDEHADRH
ncbi:Acyl-coenzyme A thioesterase PaaI, contains HGG motif [Paenibacillus algorifonticola]|uniref:Transcription factor FapR n=2 Tax=Paenibacillus algorifonticola TaxID=684063 RepID=A0A1I1Y806_9BACL|nr:Acyl-coenzyme A thioesterase PaaI, contains HGG motif [Paenibacillus algorifonticola]